MAETIPHWLTKQAALMPSQIAIETPSGEKINFLELKEKSERLAQQLATLGVKKGMHVGILSSNHMDMACTIHALSYLGAVVVLLNTRLTANEINYQLENGEVELLIVDSIDRAASLQIEKIFTYEEVKKQKQATISLQEEINLADSFTIIYTSGTTGFPKGVVHTYGNYWWSAIGSALNLKLHAADKWLIPLPLFHVSGMSTLLKSAIYGMPIYLLEKFDTKTVHQAIMKNHVTIVSVVTVMVQKLLEELGSNSYPEQLRCFLLGGGPAPKALLERAKEKNVPVFQSYGMTETSSQIVTLSATDALEKIGSAGKSLLPAQLKIIDQGQDGVGEIVVKGPMVTNGYYKNPKANANTIKDGWLHTGDLGYTDEDGFLYVVERRTDLIISGGENIYPSEIEGVLARMPAIKEAGVTSKKDDKWGQVPIAFIVKAKEITVEEVFSFLEKSLAKYKIPKEIHFIESLPRNASNKLVRNKLSTKIKR